MSVQTQIDRISGAVQDALAALVGKGVTVPDGTKVDGLAGLIAAIESGGGSAGGAIAITGSITVTEDSAKAIPLDVAKYQGEYLPEIIVFYEISDTSITETDGYAHGAIFISFPKETEFPTITKGYKYIHGSANKKLYFGANKEKTWFVHPFNGNISWAVGGGVLLLDPGGASGQMKAGSTWEYLLVWGVVG